MSVDNAQWMSIINDCSLNNQYQEGTLGTMVISKLLRYATVLTKVRPEVFGTTPSSVDINQIVAWEHNQRISLVLSHENAEAQQIAIGSVVPPEDF